MALVCWLGVAPEGFVSGDRVTGERLPGTRSGNIRVDLERVAEAAGRRLWRPRAHSHHHSEPRRGRTALWSERGILDAYRRYLTAVLERVDSLL